MPTNLPGQRPPHRTTSHVATAVWMLAAASLPTLLVSLSLLVPAPLVLPTAGLVLVCLGFALASWAWQPRMQETPVRNRALDVSAALVLMGFAATILADSDQVIAALDTLVASQETVSGSLQ